MVFAGLFSAGSTVDATRSSASGVSSRLARKAMAFSSMPTIRIFGYGDSLTAGWHDDGASFTPYAPEMEMELSRIQGMGKVFMVRHKG